MEKTRHIQKENIIQALAGGDMSTLDFVYDTYRNDFLRWASTKVQAPTRDDLIDAWHDTMIMFYEQVRDRKLTYLTCELKTFLFLIGYRRLLKMHKKAEKIDLVDEFNANKSIDENINVFEWDNMEGEQRQILMSAVGELPEQSRQILIYRFIEGKSIPEIMEAMGYKSVNTVSATLSRSLKKLKETIVERMSSTKGWKREISS